MMRKKKLFWGVFFLTAAVLLVAGNFLHIRVSEILIMLAMVILLIEGILYRNFVLILFPAAIILIQNSERLGLSQISPWSVLAAALFGSIGLSVLFPKKRQHCTFGKVCGGGSSDSFRAFVDDGDGETVDGEAVSLENSFGESVKYVTSRKLSEASLRNSFGCMMVYFNNAELMNHEASVKVNVSFGRLVLYIPASWKVYVDGNSVFADISETGRCNPDGEDYLEISGSVSFGELRIQYI